eukprot:TRINITY_DN2065_c0_g1_i1.p1 TRINITY_DN2065_c0_g1~~TRINITY_DN2065_c0_g1_i1.p1  ORF type:complete len:661 (+),score=99.24 TRINITY_DN2065_c0_g1_i1:53-1984(+)
MEANMSEAGCLARAAETAAEKGLELEAMVMLVQGIMLALAFLSIKLVSKFKIPLMTECGSVIVTGFVMGMLLHVISPHFGKAAAMFNANSFFLIILPPIIFDAGFSLTSSKSSLSSNTGTILLLAIFGTMISTVIVGTLLYVGFGPLFGGIISLWEAYAFGALISAVDPVATLAVLNEVFSTGKPAMFYLVFGESVINDAVSIVLYTVCESVLKDEASNKSVDTSVGHATASVITVFFRFWGVFIGSIVVGIVISLITAFFLRVVDLRQHQTIELVTILLSAGSMYAVAQTMELSGIMAIFVGGRLTKHWVLHNLSVGNRIFIPRLIKAISETAELYVFAFLGAAFWSYSDCLVWNYSFIAATFVVILLGRAANIFPLCFLSNRFRDERTEKIKFTEMIFMWFSGLRGAVAFALACYGTNTGVLKNGDILVTTTLVTVMATVFIFGGFSKPLLTLLGLAPRRQRSSSPSSSMLTDEGEEGDDAQPFVQPDDPNINAGEEEEEEEETGIGAAYGPPPAYDNTGTYLTRLWRSFRTSIWRSTSWLLAADTRWIKPFVCLEQTSIDRQREQMCLKLLKEGIDHTQILTAKGTPLIRKPSSSISTPLQLQSFSSANRRTHSEANDEVRETHIPVEPVAPSVLQDSLN